MDCDPGRLSPDTRSASVLIWHLPASRTVRYVSGTCYSRPNGLRHRVSPNLPLGSRQLGRGLHCPRGLHFEVTGGPQRDMVRTHSGDELDPLIPEPCRIQGLVVSGGEFSGDCLCPISCPLRSPSQGVGPAAGVWDKPLGNSWTWKVVPLPVFAFVPRVLALL